MNKKLKIAFFLLILFGVVTIGLLFIYGSGIAVLSPKGEIAEKEKDLLFLATILMLIVVLPVFGLTFGIAWKYRADNKKAKYHPDWDFNMLAEVLWWGIPCLIAIVLGVFTWKGCHELDPFRPIDSKNKPLTIQAVALQWKWLFIYPEQGIATVNFIQFPEQVPINFEITSDAPMNSFWIPELGGQVYAMAGMRSKLHLIANEVGDFRGSSANISGSGFSGMTFIAKASSEADFIQWVETVKGSQKALGQDEYKQLVKPSSYVPAAYYVLGESGLFDRIIMKYMHKQPEQSVSGHALPQMTERHLGTPACVGQPLNLSPPASLNFLSLAASAPLTLTQIQGASLPYSRFFKSFVHMMPMENR